MGKWKNAKMQFAVPCASCQIRQLPTVAYMNLNFGLVYFHRSYLDRAFVLFRLGKWFYLDRKMVLFRLEMVVFTLANGSN